MDEQRSQAHHQRVGWLEFRVRTLKIELFSDFTVLLEAQTLLKLPLRMTMVGRMSFIWQFSDEINVAEITATVAADIVHDILSMFVSFAPPKPARWLRDEF